MWIVIISMVFIAAIFFSVAIILHISDKKEKKSARNRFLQRLLKIKKTCQMIQFHILPYSAMNTK